jgi:hypothetical protein
MIATHQSNIQPVLAVRADTKEARIIFPDLLFRMMKDVDQQQPHLSHIVSWHPSGLAFVIHKPNIFVSDIMPIYFRGQTKLSSFKRQLKNYGFRRYQERRSRDSMIYYHKKFCRDEPLLLQHVVLISSKTAKNTGLSLSTLLQMTRTSPRVVVSTSTSSCLPQEPAPGCFSTTDTITTPLPLENRGDEILDEAATELPRILEAACNEDFCLDDDFDWQQHYDGLSRLAIQQWDPEVESLEYLDISLNEVFRENGNIRQVK